MSANQHKNAGGSKSRILLGVFGSFLLTMTAGKGTRRQKNSSPALPPARTAMRLDAKTIAGLTLPADKLEVIYFDERLPGHGLRLRRKRIGAPVHSTWITQYHVNGRNPRVTHGVAGKLTPAKAFEASRKILARATLGEDPQGEKVAKRQAAARTFRRRRELPRGARGRIASQFFPCDTALSDRVVFPHTARRSRKRDRPSRHCGLYTLDRAYEWCRDGRRGSACNLDVVRLGCRGRIAGARPSQSGDQHPQAGRSKAARSRSVGRRVGGDLEGQ